MPNQPTKSNLVLSTAIPLGMSAASVISFFFQGIHAANAIGFVAGIALAFAGWKYLSKI